MSSVENIQSQLDDGKYSAGVFVDFKKYFDSNDHKKLNYYGVRGIGNDWLASYLKNRKQFEGLHFSRFHFSWNKEERVV